MCCKCCCCCNCGPKFKVGQWVRYTEDFHRTCSSLRPTRDSFKVTNVTKCDGQGYHVHHNEKGNTCTHENWLELAIYQPKFKVGDWVEEYKFVGPRSAFKVAEIKNHTFRVEGGRNWRDENDYKLID